MKCVRYSNVVVNLVGRDYETRYDCDGCEYCIDYTYVVIICALLLLSELTRVRTRTHTHTHTHTHTSLTETSSSQMSTLVVLTQLQRLVRAQVWTD